MKTKILPWVKIAAAVLLAICLPLGAASQTTAHAADASILPPLAKGSLPSTGTAKTVTLLVDFPDFPRNRQYSAAAVTTGMYAASGASGYPFDSLRAYYARSSYGKLTLQGTVLANYRAKHNRQYYSDMGTLPGREALIKEIFNSFNASEDFSQFDGNADGVLDGFYVFFTGPTTSLNDIWHPGYAPTWKDAAYKLDGKSLKNYAVMFYDSGTFPVSTAAHETGHMFGLPDYYEASDTFMQTGPKGGLGGFEMLDMDNSAEHNLFSKIMLGWIQPKVVKQGTPTANYTLRPYEKYPDALVVTKDGSWNPCSEYYIVGYRSGANNNSGSNTKDAKGIVVLRANAVLDDAGKQFLYDNSLSQQKLLYLVEADGKEHIEDGAAFSAADLYGAGKALGPDTFPGTCTLQGEFTGICIDGISIGESSATVTAGFAGDTTSPALKASTPAGGVGDMPVYDGMSLTFSCDVFAAGGFDGISLRDGGNNAVGISAACLKNKLTITPDGVLPSSAALTLNLPAGSIRDAKSNTNAQPVVLKFTTSKKGPDVRWENKYPAFYPVGTIALSGGKLVSMVYTISQQVDIICTDADGAELWKKSLHPNETSPFNRQLTKIGPDRFIFADFSAYTVTLHIYDGGGACLKSKTYPQFYFGNSESAVIKPAASGQLFALFSDGIFAKLDSNLGVLSKTALSTSGSIGWKDFVVLADGGIMLTGYTKPGEMTNHSVILRRYDASLKQALNKTISDPAMDFVSYRIDATRDGCVLLSYMGKTTPNTQRGYLYVRKMDYAGGTVWTREFPDCLTLMNNALSVYVATNNTAVVEYARMKADQMTNVRIVRLSPAGKNIWTTELTKCTPESREYMDVAEYLQDEWSDDCVLLAGRMNSYLIKLNADGDTAAQDPSPGALQFSQSAVTASAPAGSVKLAVNRVGGTAGSVTVGYIVSGGTAVSGTDYLPAGGTLTFADGETAKEITIRFTGQATNGRTICLLLCNATGGAFIGATPCETVRIYSPGPARLSAVSASYNSIRICWDATGADGFEVWRAASATGKYAYVGMTAATSYVNGGLKTGTAYYYRMRSYTLTGAAKNYGAWSSVATARPIPAATAAITAKQASYNSIKVTWKAVAGATKYMLYRATSAKGAYALMTTTTTLGYTNKSVKTGVTYYYKVRAYRLVGRTKVYGGYSAIKPTKTQLAAPGSPKAAQASYNSIKVTWGAVAGATKYELYRAASKTGAYKLVAATAARSYTNTLVNTGTTYYYKVRAYRLSGSTKAFGAYSAVVSARTALAAPTAAKAARVSAASIKVSWGKVAGATQYEVWRTPAAAGGYALIAATGNATYTDTGLTAGTRYCYRVRAYRLAGGAKVYGNYSAAVNATP